jgi:succinoglycan biosynthesis protein ExoA
VCTRDRPASLRACVDSLATQTRRPRELIVVDGGTVRLPARYRRRVRRRLAPVPVRWLATEPGLPRQRNLGAERATGSVVVFLDDDVVLEPGYLEAVAAVFEADDDRTIGGVGGAQVPDPTPAESAWRRAACRLFQLESYGDGRVKRSGRPAYLLSPTRTAEVEFLSGCNMSFRREVLAEHDFDERLCGYALGEDLSFSYAVGRRWRLVATPLARLDHRQARDGRPPTRAFRTMSVFNKYLFVREQRARGVLDWASYLWANLGDLLLRLRRPGAAGLAGTLRGYGAVLAHVATGRLPARTTPALVLPPLDAWPRVSVVVPARDEARTIDACLDSILAQRYPRERLEVIVVENGSRDATAERALVRAAVDARLRVVRSAARNHAEALNDGLAHARGDVVARVDAHSRIAPDYVRRVVRELRRRPRAAAIGGPFMPAGETPFERAAGAARSSPLGVGGGYGADRDAAPHPVRSVQCGAYRRDVLEAVGGFDAAMLHGEDEELNWRVVCAGHEIWLCPDLEQPYRPRATPGALLRQYWHYGRGRARVLAKHPAFLSPRHLVPSCFVAAAVLAVVAAVAGDATPLALLAGAWAIVLVAAGLLATRTLVVRDAVLVPIAVACLHVGYGAGMLVEAVASCLRRPGAARAPLGGSHPAPPLPSG